MKAFTLLTRLNRRFLSAGSILIGVLALIMPAQAEVIPDGSVGTLNVNGNILGGTTTSNGTQQNLFHSFQEFSLDPTDTVTFVAPDSVENIITRVTGRLPSEINGTLQIANTTSNLFFINPAGIVFGPTAQLRVPGFFVASTAEQLSFSNGFAFDVESLNAPPLMTVSAPIGLQIGGGSITVNDTGHNIAKLNLADPSQGANGGIAPHVQQGSTPGLQVIPGKTLALIGNGVTFNGGVVNANSGHVEVGSVAEGSSVSLTAGLNADLNSAGFVANYDQVEDFGSIDFSNRSLVNVSGFPVAALPPLPTQVFTTQQGSLQVVGHDISLTDTSLFLGQTGRVATQAGGTLRVNAAGTLLLSGSEAAGFLRSGIFSETIGPNPSGAIDVQAAQLQMLEGAGILGLTFSAASGGNINVETTDQLTISGFNALNRLITSTINSSSASSGGSGDIAVQTPNLFLSEGGSVSSLAFSQGGSGDIFVDADDILLTGRIAVSGVPSAISASNFGPGIAGDIEIVTERLNIEDRALIAASSISSGSAGNIRITATERIDIDQPLNADTISSAINSAVLLPTALERSLFNIPDTFVPTGNAGNLNIETPILTGRGPLRISVQNAGLGTGGDVQITTDSIELRDGSQISALTNSGDGGNINLQIADSLILRNGAGLTVKSGGTGNGGNIELDSRVIVALENSDIVADAERGRGGNIDINSQHLLGTSFRDRATSESDITASSEFGINGTVEIDTPTVDPASGVIVLSTTVVDADQQIATGCANDAQGNHFIASGRGGLPQNPQSAIAGNNLWQDFRPIPTGLSVSNTPSPLVETVSQHDGAEPIFEASNWSLNHNGDVQLIAGSDVHSAAVSCLKAVM